MGTEEDKSVEEATSLVDEVLELMENKMVNS